MRTRAYRRFQRENHIKRKENIIRMYRHDNPPHKYDIKNIYHYMYYPDEDSSRQGLWEGYWCVPFRGYLNKGKIHCSCGMCREKTRNKGKHKTAYYSSINYKPSDKRKIENMENKFKEFKDKFKEFKNKAKELKEEQISSEKSKLRGLRADLFIIDDWLTIDPYSDESPDDIFHEENPELFF